MLGRIVFTRLRLAVALIAVAMLSVPQSGIWAQAPAAPTAETHAKGDIAGDWQGTLEAGKSLRTIVRIAKTDKGWTAKFYSIDQTPQPIPVSSTTLDGSTVKFTVDMVGGSYEGTLSADGNTITGTWTQAKPLPLTLVRATKETAWEIPAPPPPPKRMAADADPAFDVATIKPNNSGGATMQGLTVNGRNFQTRNSSASDLICFAYNIQKKQLVNAPDWVDKDRYDVAATIDTEGSPSDVQVRLMIRKLLTSRFGLTFHREKREMSAFVLTVAKTGQKMTKNDSGGTLPGFGMRPSPTGLMLPVFNSSMPNFVSFLQAMVVDRPVVDQTGLEGKWDFTIKFTPDDSLFNGHPPPLPAKTDTTESSPNFFDALQQQVGLKLEAQKTAVDVIAVDHLEKPSAK